MIPHVSQADRWFTNEYCTIVRAFFDSSRNVLAVSFQDGDEARLNPASLVPPALEDVDWMRVATNGHELIVPHAGGWFEIPWDAIRTQTDVAFDAHMSRNESERSAPIRNSAD